MASDKNTVRIEFPTNASSSISITSTPSKNGNTVLTIQVDNAVMITASQCDQKRNSLNVGDGDNFTTDVVEKFDLSKTWTRARLRKNVFSNDDRGVEDSCFEKEFKINDGQRNTIETFRREIPEMDCNSNIGIVSNIFHDEADRVVDTTDLPQVFIEFKHDATNYVRKKTDQSKTCVKAKVEYSKVTAETQHLARTRSLAAAGERDKRIITRSAGLRPSRSPFDTKERTLSRLCSSPGQRSVENKMIHSIQKSRKPKKCKDRSSILKLKTLSSPCLSRVFFSSRITNSTRMKNETPNSHVRSLVRKLKPRPSPTRSLTRSPIKTCLSSKKKTSLAAEKNLKQYFVGRAKTASTQKSTTKSIKKEKAVLRIEKKEIFSHPSRASIVKLKKSRKRRGKNYILLNRRKVFVFNINIIKRLNLNCKVLLKPIEMVKDVNKNLNYRNALIEKLYRKNNPLIVSEMKTFDSYVSKLVTVLSNTKADENLFLPKPIKKCNRKLIQVVHTNLGKVDEEMEALFGEAVQKSLKSENTNLCGLTSPTCYDAVTNEEVTIPVVKQEIKSEVFPSLQLSPGSRQSQRKRNYSKKKSKGFNSAESDAMSTPSLVQLEKDVWNSGETSVRPLRKRLEEQLLSGEVLIISTHQRSSQTSGLDTKPAVSSTLPALKTCVVLIKDEERAEIILRHVALEYLKLVPKNIDSPISLPNILDRESDLDTSPRDVLMSEAPNESETYRPPSHLFQLPSPRDLPFHLYQMYKKQRMIKRLWYGDRIVGKIVSSLDI